MVVYGCVCPCFFCFINSVVMMLCIPMLFVLECFDYVGWLLFGFGLIAFVGLTFRCAIICRLLLLRPAWCFVGSLLWSVVLVCFA